MILYRARGLQALHCVFQAVTAAVVFVGWSFAFARLFHAAGPTGDILFFLKYSILVGVGVSIDHLRRAQLTTDFLNLKFAENCGASVRQTLSVLLVLLLFLVAFNRQTTISREFVFSFIPVFFGSFSSLQGFLTQFEE